CIGRPPTEPTTPSQRPRRRRRRRRSRSVRARRNRGPQPSRVTPRPPRGRPLRTITTPRPSTRAGAARPPPPARCRPPGPGAARSPTPRRPPRRIAPPVTRTRPPIRPSSRSALRSRCRRRASTRSSPLATAPGTPAAAPPPARSRAERAGWIACRAYGLARRHRRRRLWRGQGGSGLTAAPPDASFRDGLTADLEATFALSERAIYDAAVKRGVLPPGRQPTASQTRASWRRHKGLIEFLHAQPDSRYRICERAGESVAYARVVQFGEMEELTELMVDPNHQGQGIGRALLEQCWPGDPTPELGRVVVATGEPNDLGLYMEFGVMPVAGHWHIRQRTDKYLERRSQEIERVETAVHVLKADRAVEQWCRLEPPVVGHERRALHEFLCRDRTCLAALDPDTGEATSLCWVSAEGE